MNDNLIPYREGMEYGIGMDSPSADARNVAVLGEPTSIPNATGRIVTFELTQVSSDEDLQTALGVSASVDAGFGCFSASASMDFAQRCHVHSNSVFMLASVEVHLAFSQIRAPKLDPDAAAKLADDQMPRFQEMFGDVFVRGIQTGGRFFAVAEIHTTDRTDQESLSVSLSGSYGPFQAEGTFSTDFKKAMSSRSMHVTVHTEGGVVPEIPTSLDEIQQVAKTFASTVEGHAVPYAVLLDKYSILDIPKPPNYIDLQQQLDVLTFCAQERNAIWTRLSNVQYVLTNPNQFETGSGKYDMAPLMAYRTALEADLKSVAKAASLALDHPRDATLPILTAQPVDLPARRAGEAEALAATGEALSNADPLIKVIRDTQPEGPLRRGFHIGIATEFNNSLWGPGAQSIKDALTAAEKPGFDLGAWFCLDRNLNPDPAKKGAAVIAADERVRTERARTPPGLFWLGFDIGTGLFGDPKLGAQGNTIMGPGSERIRASLHADGPKGFDAARDFNVALRHG